MSLTNPDALCFDNLGGGAAREKFDDALAEVLRNIQDPNTDAKTVREIVLRVRIHPDEQRQEAGITIACIPKLAEPKVFPSRVFFGRAVGGRLSAYEINAGQMDLFPKTKGNVVGLETAAAAASAPAGDDKK